MKTLRAAFVVETGHGHRGAFTPTGGPSPAILGAAQRYAALFEALADAQGLDLHVLTESRLCARATLPPVRAPFTVHTLRREPYHLAPFYLYLPGVLRVRRLIRSLAPDVVVGFGTEGSAGWLAVHSGRPAVIYVQGIVSRLFPYLSWSRPRRRIARWAERTALRSCAGAIAESRFAQDWARSISPNMPVALIPNTLRHGFETATVPPQTDEVWCVGELSDIKNPRFVLDAYARSRGPGSLHFAGTGPLLPQLRADAERSGIASRCAFHGFMDTEVLLRRLGAARCLAMGSRMDTSPNVIVEAHALGVPVIAPAVGGIPERVRDGTDGFLVRPGDSGAMAGAIARLLADAGEAARMGQAGRARVLREHAPSATAPPFAEFLRRIAGSGRQYNDGHD